MSEVLEPIGSGEEWTAEQMTHLLDLYERTLGDLGYSPASYPEPGHRVSAGLGSVPKFDCLNHAMWMCGCIRRFLKDYRNARAYRWIGMVQGLLLMGGVFSLDELAEQERKLPGPVPRRVHDVVPKDCPPTER